MIRVCSISSGSKGNCIFVSSGTTHLLVDMGITLVSLEHALDALKVGLSDIGGVLITHSHRDHVAGLKTLCKKHKLDVFCNIMTARELRKHNINTIVLDDNDIFINDITVCNFKVEHDVECSGFSFLSGGVKVSVATDMGKFDDYIIDAMSESSLAIVESNHDYELLQSSGYPAHLKKRITGGRGHLSNKECAKLVLELARRGTNNFVLAHLSQENNYPELAFDTIVEYLDKHGYIEGRDVHISIATQNAISKVFDIY